MRRLLRVTAIGAIALVEVGAAPPKAPFSATSYVHAQRLVDVGGRRMNIICSGSGSPTVILEAGLGDDATVWRQVQPAIARRTRVCSSDRAGMGFSDPAATSRDAAAVVRDLHALLRGAGISPPYVLVGHSIGGLYVRLFADRYPKDVAGLVLVDPTSEYEEEQMPKVLPTLPQAVRDRDKQLEACAANVSRGTCAMFPGLAAYRKQVKAAGCPQVSPAECAVADVEGEHKARASYWRDVALEAAAIPKSSAEVRAEQRRYGALPLIVLSESEQGNLQQNQAEHSSFTRAQQRAAWQTEDNLQERIARLSTVGRHLVVAGSMHSIQLDHPSAVVSAVADVTGAAQHR